MRSGGKEGSSEQGDWVRREKCRDSSDTFAHTHIMTSAATVYTLSTTDPFTTPHVTQLATVPSQHANKSQVTPTEQTVAIGAHTKLLPLTFNTSP